MFPAFKSQFFEQLLLLSKIELPKSLNFLLCRSLLELLVFDDIVVEEQPSQTFGWKVVGKAVFTESIIFLASLDVPGLLR